MRSYFLALTLGSLGGLAACDKAADQEPPKPEAVEAIPAKNAAPERPGIANPATPNPATPNSGADPEKGAGTDDLEDLLAEERRDPPPSPEAKQDPGARGASADTEPEASPSKAAAGNDPKPNPATEAPEAKIVRGTTASGEGFSTWLETTGAYQAGKPGAVTAVVVSSAPYKCNAEYPYKFQAAGGSGVSYTAPVARGAKVDQKRTTLSIPFTANAAGKAEVKGTLSFSVCTDERCLVEKRDLSVGFDVQ